MRLGISVATAYRSGDRDGVSSVIEQARVARDVGLDTLSVGDHHATGTMPYLQNAPMLGRLLADWDDRPAGCLFLLPLWQPVLLAEQVGTLAEIAAGPFIVQIGLGDGDGQFRAMGQRRGDRGRRLEEGLPLVQALLRGESVSSELFGVQGARIAPVPGRGVEWWVGGGTPKAIDRAARLGDCWYANADLTLESAAALMGVYREACARHDRRPTRIPIRKDVFVAETAAEAEKVGDALMGAGYRGFERGAVAYGDPDTVAEQLAPFASLGFTDVIIRSMPAPLEQSVRSVELSGEVRARLQTA